MINDTDWWAIYREIEKRIKDEMPKDLRARMDSIPPMNMKEILFDNCGNDDCESCKQHIERSKTISEYIHWIETWYKENYPNFDRERFIF